MNKSNEISSYLENLSLLILGIFLLAFPLVFTTATTDPFSLPKQVLLTVAVLAALLLFGVKTISDATVKIRRTPFDLILLTLIIFVLFSSLLSVNRYDSLIAFVPLMLAVLSFYIIVNILRSSANSLLFLIAALILGACLTSVVGTLSYFKIYLLPFELTKNQGFTTLGSMLDQAIYLALVLPIALHLASPLLKTKQIKDIENKSLIFAITSIIIAVGLGVSLYQLLVIQKPALLPLEIGFRTAFAAISQDTGRVLQAFLFGSGFGTYFTDFTRFKPATINLSQTLWSVNFVRSSSFVLEILATTGIMGLTAFILLIVKVLRNSGSKTGFVNSLLKNMQANPVFLSLVLLVIASLALPLSFIIQTLLFILLALYAGAQALTESGGSLEENEHKGLGKFFDIELYFVALKKGFLAATSPFVTSNPEGVRGPMGSLVGARDDSIGSGGRLSKVLPVSVFVLIALLVAGIGIYAGRYVASDVIFQNSLVAASSNNGLQTYNDQISAINMFPYRDAYHRIYSQTNLALANSLAASQPKDSSPSTETQQTITTLIQQAIDSARRATTISPQTSANWQNLSAVYRALIGYGQNAESFAISANQQAALLDPNNPQQYLNLGGIYFQLKKWDDAQRQFQIAVNLKSDFANAYYNLGHALEEKGDLQNALTQYQAVKSLVASDAENLKRIDREIKALQNKLGTTKASGENSNPKPTEGQSTQPIGINTPSTQLPEKKKPVEIPGPASNAASPTAAPTAEPTSGPSTSPIISPAASPTPTP